MKTLLYILPAFLLLSACAPVEKEALSEENAQTDFQYAQTIPEGGRITDEQRGAHVWFGLGALTGVEGVAANGVAQTFVFEDGSTQHGMQINIERPEDGYFYEGWLVNPATGDVISSGHIKSLFGDVRHALQFTDERDLRDYTKVIVTLEPDDGDPAPADHVAEGTLNQIER